MEEKDLKTEKKHSMLLLITVGLLVVAASVATLVPHGSDMLYRENRKAASAPVFSFDTLLDGSYGEGLESYVSDRVALRQFWIGAKCFVDEMVFMKTEENGILIGKEERLFTKDFGGGGEDDLLDKNIGVIEEYASGSDIPVTVMIAPSASSVYRDMLPAYAPQEAEKDILAGINERLSLTCDVVDLYPVLKEHEQEYIYYRNDHHWTTLGAYYAYEKAAGYLGIEAVKPDWDKAATVNGFLGTHYAKSRYFKAVPDTITYFPSDTEISIMRVTGDAEFEEERRAKVVNTDKFSGYDKYAAFLDGNNGYSVIKGTGTGRILVVKDSFANSLIPFMTGDFEQIGVVDYRNYSYGLSNLAKKEHYDRILIIYSYASLKTDNRLVYMNRPAQ